MGSWRVVTPYTFRRLVDGAAVKAFRGDTVGEYGRLSDQGPRWWLFHGGEQIEIRRPSKVARTHLETGDVAATEGAGAAIVDLLLVALPDELLDEHQQHHEDSDTGYCRACVEYRVARLREARPELPW